MSVTITKSGVTFTFNDGDVQDVNTQITADLEHEAMPMMTADAAFIFDFSGVKKIINISGSLTDNLDNNVLSVGSAVTINEQREWLESLIDGGQSGITFSSNYSSTYNGSTFNDSNVLVANIRFAEQVNKHNELGFSITLFVGDA